MSGIRKEKRFLHQRFSGMDIEAENFPSRVVLLTILSSTLLIFTAYSASLTSFLAVFKLSFPFVDFQTMYYQTDYVAGSLSGTAYELILKVSLFSLL